MLRLSTILFLVFCGFTTTGAQDKDSAAACNGDFDFYLLLDTSSSVRDYFDTEVVPFVQKLVDSYSNPKLRISFITFDDEPDVIVQLPLTSNRIQMQAAIEHLKGIPIIGRTYLAPPISKAISLIRADGKSRASVLLTVTDGALEDPGQAAAASTVAEGLGATITTIGIGDVVHSQLMAVATYPSLVYVRSSASGLSALVEQIARITCLEVDSITPNPACPGQGVVMSGSGLNNTKNQTAAVCHFTRTDQPLNELTTRATPMGYHRLTCPLPSFNDTSNFEGSWTLQFSLNGKTYSTATEELSISNCSGVTGGQTNHPSVRVTEAPPTSHGGVSSPQVSGTIVGMVVVPAVVVLVIGSVVAVSLALIACKLRRGREASTGVPPPPKASTVVTMQDNPSYITAKEGVAMEPNPCYSTVQANSVHKPTSAPSPSSGDYENI